MRTGEGMADSLLSTTPVVELVHAGFAYGEMEEDEGGGPSQGDGMPSTLYDTSESMVEDISFSVKAGECLVLCGRSGGGKSTVLSMVDGLAGTFYPGNLTGEVRVCGTSVHMLAPCERTRLMGVVLQDPRSQFFMSSVRDEIAFSAENLGVEPEEVMRRVQRAAALTGVGSLLDEGLDRLSSGQKQRVAIAAAIVNGPALLVLDEPMANLDQAGAVELVELLARLKGEGIACVISEHRLHRLLPIADRFLYIRKGRVAARWNTAEFTALSSAEVAPYGLRHPAMNIEEADSPDEGSPEALSNTEPAGAERTGAGSAGAERADAGSGAGESFCYSVENLTYRYRSTGRGIENATARFCAGTVTALLGDNGTGKTTLAKIVCGVLGAKEGRVCRDGVALTRAARRKASYLVMQDADYQLYADSVGNEVVLGRVVDDALRRRALDSLAAFGLVDLIDRHPASLSGGQKQRVTIAAAYCSDADLIVLDEPTSGLDGAGVLQVAHWCRALADAGKVVVVITHDTLLARLACDNTITLAVGSDET